jgi:DNA (cytosine-5)-methyltransferase 1
MNELHLFAGAGGGILGGLLLGHRPVCAVEIEPYPRKVLLQRQRDGILPRFPIWDDVCTFDGKPWRGKVDVVCGGFPCQDISSAGRGKGIDGERSGLWGEMQRIVGEVKPKHVFVENSPLLNRRGLALVIRDLAEMGYDSKWCVLGSDSSGGCHHRKRMWILATDTKRIGSSGSWGFFNGEREKARDDRETDWFERILQGKTLPYVCGENHGMACSVDRTKACGNGQDPRVVRAAWELMTENDQNEVQ